MSQLVSSIVKDARDRALQKSPGKPPLIVETGAYYNIAVSTEILGVAVKAPFGSGKTFGIGLKSYHDARLNNLPLAGARVLLVRVRNALSRPEMVSLVKSVGPTRVMCGGLALLMLAYAARAPDACYSDEDKTCYTTLTRGELEKIERLIFKTTIGGTLFDRLSIDTLYKALKYVRESILGGRQLIIIVDEVEGFLDAPDLFPGITASDIVYSNLVAFGELHDRGLRRVRLVMLVQSSAIEREWDGIKDALRRGVAYKGGIWAGEQPPGEAREYVCVWSRDRRDRVRVGALAGRVMLIESKYYPKEVYVDYMMRALKIVADEDPRGKGRTAAMYYRSLAGSRSAREKVAKKLRFIESIAPRIAFDYVDNLLDNMVESGKSTPYEALAWALEKTAEYWERMGDIHSFYAALIRGRRVYNLVSDTEYIRIVHRLAADLYKAGPGKANPLCEPYVKTAKYHSTYIAAATCPNESEPNILVVMLRRTRNKPPQQYSSNIRRHLAELLDLVVSQTVAGAPRRLRVTLLSIVPDDIIDVADIAMQKSLNDIADSLALKVSAGGKTRTLRPQVKAVYTRLDREDFIIVAAMALGKSPFHGMLWQFIEYRYREILSNLAKTLEAGP